MCGSIILLGVLVLIFILDERFLSLSIKSIKLTLNSSYTDLFRCRSST
jgi:hypothetical protein